MTPAMPKMAKSWALMTAQSMPRTMSYDTVARFVDDLAGDEPGDHPRTIHANNFTIGSCIR